MLDLATSDIQTASLKALQTRAAQLRRGIGYVFQQSGLSAQDVPA